MLALRRRPSGTPGQSPAPPDFGGIYANRAQNQLAQQGLMDKRAVQEADQINTMLRADQGLRSNLALGGANAGLREAEIAQGEEQVMMQMLESLRSGFQSAETARLGRESLDQRARLGRESLDQRARLGREAKAEEGRLNRESRELIARSAKGRKSVATISEATSQWKPEHQALAHYNFNQLLSNLPEGTSFEDLTEQQAARLTNGALDSASEGIDLGKSPAPLVNVLEGAFERPAAVPSTDPKAPYLEALARPAEPTLNVGTPGGMLAPVPASFLNPASAALNLSAVKAEAPKAGKPNKPAQWEVEREEAKAPLPEDAEPALKKLHKMGPAHQRTAWELYLEGVKEGTKPAKTAAQKQGEKYITEDILSLRDSLLKLPEVGSSWYQQLEQLEGFGYQGVNVGAGLKLVGSLGESVADVLRKKIGTPDADNEALKKTRRYKELFAVSKASDRVFTNMLEAWKIPGSGAISDKDLTFLKANMPAPSDSPETIKRRTQILLAKDAEIRNRTDAEWQALSDEADTESRSRTSADTKSRAERAREKLRQMGVPGY